MDNQHKKPAVLFVRFREQSGQSLIIIAFAFIALMIIIGLAIDLGLVYIERIKIGKACDAAALAAAQDLPFEQSAIKRAMQYMAENGYGPDLTNVTVVGPGAATLQQGWVGMRTPGVDVGDNMLFFDTQTYEDALAQDVSASADKIRVRGVIHVPMNFIRFANAFGFNFDTVAVAAAATAENVSSLDIMLVYDTSGSMTFDTRCYGCYEQRVNYSTGEYDEYPIGIRRTLPYPDWIREPQDEIWYGGHQVLAREAEFFAYATSYQDGSERNYHAREPSLYRYQSTQYPGQFNTYWTLQRVYKSDASGYSAETGDRRGAHMMVGPHNSYVSGFSSVHPVLSPRLDYAFDIPRTGTWYVWIRAQCGDYGNKCVVHWGADGNPRGSTSNSTMGDQNCSYKVGFCTNLPWRWVRVGSTTFSSVGAHHINIWGGGVGFKLDKIVITTNSQGPDTSVYDRAPSFIRETTPNNWDQVDNAPAGTYMSYSYSGEYGGPPDTGNRDHVVSIDSNLAYDYASSPCNTNYGLNTGYDFDGDGTIEPHEYCTNSDDELFDDKQPIRYAKVAARNFVRRLNARFDQVGFVKYSGSGTLTRELTCQLVSQQGAEQLPDGQGIWDPDTGVPDEAWEWCYDHKEADGDRDDGRDHGSILWAIEQMYPDSGTNMGEGMREGIEGLRTGGSHYGRPNAASVMILLTDGVPTSRPDSSDPCRSFDGWPDGETGTNHDCVIYYADQAFNNNIVIYTIALGVSADEELLKDVAERTGGRYFKAASGSALDSVFQEIADQLLLRLID